MPSLEIAHIREQGQDMVIVPLSSEFGQRPSNAQRQAVAELQQRSMSAGLKGTVVPVWDSGGGRMAFIAPRPWHPFFQSLGLSQVHASLNRTLSW